MRFAAFVPGGLALLLACSVVVRAQFQEPTKEELQMTADPKAPGASYVYLYREEATDQQASTHTEYIRIKVLTEKGKEQATVQIPYVRGGEKLPEVEGRTIHADGAVVPLTEKPADLVDVKTKEYQVDKLVFTLPSADVGSILEFRVKKKFSDGADNPVWLIQQSAFVHKAHYLFKSLLNYRMSYISRIGNDAKVQSDKNGTYTLDLSDIPPVPDEEWMPPLNTFKWSVWFFASDYSSGDAFWDAANKRWADALNEVVAPNGGLKKAAAEIVSSTDSQTEKARKIYAAMMKIENTDYTRHKSEAERKKEKIKEIKTVEDVWKQQRGTSDDIALLFVAMCRAAGLDVSPMKVVDRQRALFDRGFLSSGQLDDYIAVAKLDGKDVYLDPGEKMCRFGILHWRHAVATGFRLSGKTSSIASTPPGDYRTTSVQRIADLAVSPSGDVQGIIRIVLSGQQALYWRQLTLRNDESEVKKQFNEWVHEFLPDGVQGEFDHFVALDDYESNLLASVNVSGTLGEATGKRFFLAGLFFESHSKHPFVAEENRKIPVDVHYPRVETDHVTYRLPPGYTVESGPQATEVAWPEHAQLKIKTVTSGDSVDVTRVFAYGYTILDPKEYTGLHDFYQKVAAADQQQIVLTRATTAKAK